ncbi:tetratricopeptide repeat protein 6 [Ara ararauna]
MTQRNKSVAKDSADKNWELALKKLTEKVPLVVMKLQFVTSDEFSSTDSDTSKSSSRQGKTIWESCKKRYRVISKAKQQDLNVGLGRVLRKGSKQPSVRSAQDQLKEARDVTRPDTSKIYEENFQQSKPEEPTSTPALPVKVVARSIDEIIASLQSTSPSSPDQTIKELLESVLGQNYNIKMEAPTEHEEMKTEYQVLPSFHQASLKTPVIQKEFQAAENESLPKDDLLMYNKQVPSLDVLQVEGKAISKIKPDEVQKELQKENDLQESLPPQASNIINGAETARFSKKPVFSALSEARPCSHSGKNATDLSKDFGMHLIYLFQVRISAALDDLNFINKWSKNKADTYLSMAEIYRKQGNNTFAIISYSTAIKCNPTDDDVYFRRAELYFEQNQFLLAMDDYAKDAEKSFKKAMKLLKTSAKKLPNTFEAAEMYYLTGLCYMEQKRLLQAYDAFSRAIRLHSSYPDAFYQQGLCRVQLGQAKCIQDFNQALALCPSHFQAYMSRAAYYGCKGRYCKAILNCNEAIKILPNSVQAYFYQGTLKCQNKMFKAAIEDLSKTIDLNKVCILAYYNRAVSYHQIKDFREALKDYGILLLLELNKEITFKVLINHGLLYMELDDYANACEDFKGATLLGPDDSQIFQALGICYHRLHEFEEAVKSFDQVLKLDPASVDAYVGRGNSYMEKGDETGSKQAQKDCLRAVHLNPKCVKARIYLGYNLQALGKLQRAWSQFTVAICIDPKCHAAHAGRASVCVQRGETFAAFQDTNTALKLTTTAALLTNRGVINQLMGYLPCAMKDYQQAISVDPNYAFAYFNAANIYFNNQHFSQVHYSIMTRRMKRISC